MLNVLVRYKKKAKKNWSFKESHYLCGLKRIRNFAYGKVKELKH